MTKSTLINTNTTLEKLQNYIRKEKRSRRHLIRARQKESETLFYIQIRKKCFVIMYKDLSEGTKDLYACRTVGSDKWL